jgi:hypothetical protein
MRKLFDIVTAFPKTTLNNSIRLLRDDSNDVAFKCFS